MQKYSKTIAIKLFECLFLQEKKILPYFTHNNRNKQPFIVAPNLSQSKQPRMTFSRVLRSRIRWYTRKEKKLIYVVYLSIKRSSHVSFRRAAVRSLPPSTQKAPGRASQYLFCYFGAVPVQSPQTNKSKECMTCEIKMKRGNVTRKEVREIERERAGPYSSVVRARRPGALYGCK